jgi:hypothetical protein
MIRKKCSTRKVNKKRLQSIKKAVTIMIKFGNHAKTHDSAAHDVELGVVNERFYFTLQRLGKSITVS